MLAGIFADKPVFRKFLIVVSITLLSTIIFSTAAGLLIDFIYGINIMKDGSALSDFSDPNVVAAMKLMQMLTTGIGMFLLPSLVAASLFSQRPGSYLSLEQKPTAPAVAYTILLMFAAVPLINLMMSVNQQMHLPEFLSGVEQWMKESEENAMKITEAFLKMDTTSELFYNLLIVAVLPALGEEFLFRGILQRLFHEQTKNIHLAIFLTAALFSAFHMQFYGFLPRMFLGVLFGYLLVWSGSMWVPVLAHFVNNGAAVIVAFIAARNELPFNQDTLGTTEADLPFAISSAFLVFLFVVLIRKASIKNAT